MKRKLFGYFRLLQRHQICPRINPNSMVLEAFIRKIFHCFNSTFSNLKLSSKNNYPSYTNIFKIAVFLTYSGYRNGFSLCIYTVFLWDYAYVYGTTYSCMVPVIYLK